MKRSTINELLRNGASDDCAAYGWIRTRRDSRDTSFIEINDGSCQRNLQLVLSGEIAGTPGLSTGAAVRAQGKLTPSPAAGQALELQVNAIDVIGACPEEYPLQKKRHSFEFLREIAHLRPRSNTFGAVFRVRSELAHAVHDFFHREGFYLVHTPIITASDCEGAGEMFRVTTLDMNQLTRKDGKIDYSADFFGAEAHLTVSGQLEGELFATALGKIYTFGPTFRAENSNTARHLSEFWMIEPEMAFATLNEDMELAEAFLKHLFRAMLERCPDEMAFFDDRIQKGVIDRLERIIAAPFERVTYTDAMNILTKADQQFEYQPSWGADLQSEHERYLTEKHFGVPVIVTDYPKDIKAFYMRLNDDGRTVRAMDVLVAGVGEIIGGSEREYRLDVLEERMRAMALDPQDYWWYLDTRRFGTVPHAGFGLGFERAVQFVTGMQNIRDVIPFPRTPGNARF